MAFAGSAFDEVAKLRIHQETIRRENRMPKFENEFHLNPYNLQLITRKIGHEPPVTEEDERNFREMHASMAEHKKKPQEKKENLATGLPRTAGQEYGWWYTQAGDYTDVVRPKKSSDETRFAGEYWKLKGKNMFADGK